MRTIIFILQKEFIQIFRNKTLLPIIFILPIIQLLILVNAATFEMKLIKMAVVDQDLSSTSRQLISKFDGSEFFHLEYMTFSKKEAENLLLENKVDLVINIPEHFEKKLVRENKSEIQLLINAINGTAAGLINGYSSQILAQYNKNIRIDWLKMDVPMQSVDVSYSYWYNPEMNYKIYMLPGILVILVTVIGMFLTAINLIREKEMGTIEQINVTPIKKYQFIIGKLLPFWIIALFELAFGLTIGFLFFDLPAVGSIWLVFLFTSIYLIVALGFGLFLTTIAHTQQQIMFLAFFFMIVFILMSGLFTPVESMPQWAQKVNILNPFAYFMKVIRMVLLKGSGLADISKEIYAMLIYGSSILGLAVWRHKKVA
jgi:ABC-2 type transport system permease protein